MVINRKYSFFILLDAVRRTHRPRLRPWAKSSCINGQHAVTPSWTGAAFTNTSLKERRRLTASHRLR